MALSLLALEEPLTDRPILDESEQESMDRKFDEIIRANFPDLNLPLRVVIAALPPKGSSWGSIDVAGRAGRPAPQHRRIGYRRPQERSPPARGAQHLD